MLKLLILFFIVFSSISCSIDNDSSGLGPLSDLEGTWVSDYGWNVVSLPKLNNPFSFDLLMFDYSETLTFTSIGATPNRGVKSTQYTYGLQYTQIIVQNSNNKTVHEENGSWLITQDPAGSYPISRSSVIPHGDVLLAQGNSLTYDGPPSFSNFSVLPIGAEGLGQAYNSPYYSNPNITFPPENMNQVLVDAISNQDIISTTQLSVTTQNQGGIVNIPFVTQNANVNYFTCDFYIETVQDNTDTYLQLQYTQNSFLNFLVNPNTNDLVAWPHGNVNTLRKVS